MVRPKLDVLFIGPKKTSKTFGGVETILREEHTELTNRGYHTSYLSLDNLFGSRNYFYRILFPLYVFMYLFRYKVKVAYIHGPYYLLSTLFFLRLFRIKIITKIHGIPTPSIEPSFSKKLIARLQILINTLTLRLVHVRLAISDANAVAAKDLYGIFFNVVYNGYSPKIDTPPLRCNERPIVFFVGSLIPYKGIEDIIKSLYVGTILPCDIYIAGSGYYDKKLKNVSSKVDNLHFLGRISDVEKDKMFSMADIFLYPSHNEWFGMAFLEAMDYSLPILSTKSGAIPEVVGDAGLLVNKGSPTELHTALNKLIKNPNLRESMGRIGKKRLSLFHIQNTVDSLEYHIKEVLK